MPYLVVNSVFGTKSSYAERHNALRSMKKNILICLSKFYVVLNIVKLISLFPMFKSIFRFKIVRRVLIFLVQGHTKGFGYIIVYVWKWVDLFF